MKLPGYVAIVVCLLLVFMLFEGLTWPWHPQPGWQPGWWQSHTLAKVGHLLFMPAMIPVLILENFGIFNHGIELSATVFGLLVEIVVVFVVAYLLARYWHEVSNDD
jgi:hypothetical protein